MYLKFKGGKGVATALGVFLAVKPAAVLASLFVFIGVVRIGGYVSLGSITAAALLPFWVWVFLGSPSEAGLACMIGLLIWLKHSSNIRRLLKGEEKSWKKDTD